MLGFCFYSVDSSSFLSIVNMLLLLQLLLASVALSFPTALLEPQKRTSNKLGGVACENIICSQIGIGLLEAGGNAADALVGTLFCVGVVAPWHSGIGGGGKSIIAQETSVALCSAVQRASWDKPEPHDFSLHSHDETL
jgi:gamma-glutamyltranspeptidase